MIIVVMIMVGSCDGEYNNGDGDDDNSGDYDR